MARDDYCQESAAGYMSLPGSRPKKPRIVTLQSDRAQLRISRLLTILKGRVLSSAAISAELYCDRSLTTEYLRHLRAEPRRVRIARYDIVDRARVPMYELGTEPDAPLTRKTNPRRHSDMKADPARYARYLERETLNRKKKRDAVPPEQRQRRRLCKDEEPSQRIVELLNQHAGYDTRQIAAKLNVGERSIRTALGKLRVAGKVRRAVHGWGKTWKWETPENPLPAPLALGQPKHSWAAALFGLAPAMT